MTPAVMLERLGGGRQVGDVWVAFCPVRADHGESITVTETPDGQARAECSAGCHWKAILKALPRVGGATPARTSAAGRREVGRPSPPAPSAEDGRKLKAVALNTLKRREITTLFPDLKMPIGTVVTVCGQQGIGKGTLVTRLGADVSNQGHGVIFIGEEDSAAAVIKPRMEAAGGDCERVFVVGGVRPEEGGILLPRDTRELADLAHEHNVRLVVIDPWTNHVDGMDLDKGTVRSALMPLSVLAEECGLCVVLVAHPVKNAGRGDPLDEIAHASAVSQIARSAFYLTLDPEHGSSAQDNPYRLLSQVKANLTPYGRTLRYELIEVLLPAANDEPEIRIVAAKVAGDSDLDYRAIRRQEQRERNRVEDSDNKTGQALRWLRNYLTEQGGPMLKSHLLEAGARHHHSARSLERASTQICDSSWDPGTSQGAVWALRNGGSQGAEDGDPQ